MNFLCNFIAELKIIFKERRKQFCGKVIDKKLNRAIKNCEVIKAQKNYQMIQ